MPYTQSQLRCLKGMDLVPWVERSWLERPADSTIKHTTELLEHGTDAAETLCDAVVAAEGEVAKREASRVEPDNAPTHPNAVPGNEPVDLMQTPLVEIPFRGKRCTQLGKSDALLLILVESVSTHQSQYPFEPADAKIFDDMLRAIAWRRQYVCLGVLPPLSAPSLFVDNEMGNDAPTVSDLVRPHRDAVLLFKQSVPETGNVDELVVPLGRKSMLAWQLPHPCLLRESPQRKRQAWNVLKAARAQLG